MRCSLRQQLSCIRRAHADTCGRDSEPSAYFKIGLRTPRNKFFADLTFLWQRTEENDMRIQTKATIRKEVLERIENELTEPALCSIRTVLSCRSGALLVLRSRHISGSKVMVLPERSRQAP